MKISNGLFGLGLFLAGGGLTISCGGDDNNGSNSTAGANTAGSGTGGSSAGTAGGGKSTGGAGGGSSIAGTSAGGTSTAGTTSNGGDNGGPGAGGDMGFGGDIGFGGAGLGPDDFVCDPVPAQGSACQQGTTPCLTETGLCRCQDLEWRCDEFGVVECPANAMTGDECTGFGQCPGQQCGCFQNNVFCGLPD